MRLPFLLLVLGSVVAEKHVPDDVAPNYGYVKELLRHSSLRSASLLGRDFDPSSINRMTSQMKDDGTEAYANREILSEVFETDIILTPEQADFILNQRNPFGRAKRQLSTEPNTNWKQLTIPFNFDGKQGQKDERFRRIIRETLRYMETETCFRFKENGTGDGINFVDRGGCFSQVGRRGGMQQLSISPGCDTRSIISHEVLHALGVWHEQSRIDRDNYVRIDHNWIMQGLAHAFDKRLQTENIGTPYDMGSVMHYTSKSFTTDWNHETIVTKEPMYQQTLGQRIGLTFKDAKLVNDKYCSNICKRKLPCSNNGYTDPNDCNKCRCPNGYTGRFCEQLQKTACGGELIASGQWQTISSSRVMPKDNCIWRIKSPAGQKIEAVFDRVHFPCPEEVCESYVEYKYHKSKAETGARLCCKRPATSIISQGDEVLVFFKGATNVQQGYTGFSMRYRTNGAPTPPPPTRRTTTPASTTRMVTRPVTTVKTTKQTINTTTKKPRPTTTKPKGPTGCWGSWGAWSQCTKPCGGCGTKQRRRTCSGGNKKCLGSSTQTQPCNQQSCKKSTKTCTGRLLIPCDLLPQLRFLEQRTVPASPSRWNDEVRKDMASTLQATRFYRNPTSLDRIRRRFKRQSDHPMCEKKFTYICPTNLLTISIDWKTARPNNDVINMDDEDDVMECCIGYKANGGICQKI